MSIWEKAIDFLVSSIGQSAVDAWRQNSAIDTDLSNLRAALPKARLLIERSECWRLPKYHPIDELLPQLKDAVYEAESIVDELEYQRLKNEVERSLPGINFLRNWMGDFPTMVKRVLDRLNNMYTEMKETCDNRGVPENPNQFSGTARPITSTFLDTSDVYGRDEQLQNAIRLLGVLDPGSGSRKKAKKMHYSNVNVGESSSSMNKKGNVSVISILGMGGVGKTTLAQMLCNNLNVELHFDSIMWVCVSDKFDLVRLNKEIIENFTKKDCNITNLNALQNKLRAEIEKEEEKEKKRFLLVLDDVWTKEWYRLIGPMKGAKEGSMIMVTTRSRECVEIADTDIDIRGVINLEGLEEHIFWELFKRYAFDSATNSKIDSELEYIGKRICSRLKGSPLAAKTIGGILRTNMDARHWRSIHNSPMWELQREEHDLLPILQLSYQYLPSHLKKCFSYCSLYPKDFQFTKWELIKLWIMEGFINLQQFNVHWEEPYLKEAEGCFHDLVQRCFFIKTANDKYVIHDLMHDLCQSITKDECFCLEDADLENNISFNIRHLSIFREVNQKEQEKLCKYVKLLSVRVSPQRSCSFMEFDKWCENLPNIRSLSLVRCKFKILPNSIGKLKHLEYLDISFSDIEMFPDSFFTLYKLLYLNMKGCSNISSFPKEFEKLINLRFLYLPATKLILLGHMERLARRIEFRNMPLWIGSDKKLMDLKFMVNLSGNLNLYNLEIVPNKKDAEEAHLNNKPLINHLGLFWSPTRNHTGDQSLRDENHDGEVLEGLWPHPNLKILDINCYGGINLSPSWLKEQFLPNLIKVSIRDCVNVSTISHLPRCITKLFIRHCQQLTNLQNCLLPSHLPMLKHIDISECKKLYSLQVESFGGFLFLEHLKIEYCSKLTCPNAMVLPPSIKNLSLKSCGDLEKSIPSCLQNLTSLEELSIMGCLNLVCFPPNVASNLRSLRKLLILDCCALQSLGGLNSLASLQELDIRRCPRLEETRGQDVVERL